jgi:hypothetical protein
MAKKTTSPAPEPAAGPAKPSSLTVREILDEQIAKKLA